MTRLAGIASSTGFITSRQAAESSIARISWNRRGKIRDSDTVKRGNDPRSSKNRRH